MYDYSSGLKFKDIYYNVDLFMQDLQDYGIYDPETTEEEEILYHKYFFHILMARYCNYNIFYDFENSFRRHFMLDYYNIFEEYCKKLELIKLMYSLTQEDLLIVGDAISSVGLNDNAELNPMSDIIKYISSQNVNITHQNKLVAYINAMENAQNKHINQYLYEFEHHFETVVIDENYFFEED